MLLIRQPATKHEIQNRTAQPHSCSNSKPRDLVSLSLRHRSTRLRTATKLESRPQASPARLFNPALCAFICRNWLRQLVDEASGQCSARATYPMIPGGITCTPSLERQDQIRSEPVEQRFISSPQRREQLLRIGCVPFKPGFGKLMLELYEGAMIKPVAAGVAGWRHAEGVGHLHQH